MPWRKAAMISCKIRRLREKQNILIQITPFISIKKYFCDISHDRRKKKYAKHKRK